MYLKTCSFVSACYITNVARGTFLCELNPTQRTHSTRNITAILYHLAANMFTYYLSVLSADVDYVCVCCLTGQYDCIPHGIHSSFV